MLKLRAIQGSFTQDRGWSERPLKNWVNQQPEESRLSAGIFPSSIQAGSSGTGTNIKPPHPFGGYIGRGDHGEKKRDRLQEMDGSKATEPDGIHPAIVKLLGKILVNPLTHPFNASLDDGRLPVDRLTSTDIPVHKGRDGDTCCSYRSAMDPRKCPTQQDGQSHGGQQAIDDEAT